MMNTSSTTQATTRQRSPFGLVVTTASVVIVAIALITLIGQNTDQVDIGFLGWDFAFPLSVGLVVATIGGAIFAFALSGFIGIRRKRH